MRFPRSAGVLLHPTSLPTNGVIGDLGQSAYRFVDFLSQSGQTIWQMLPLSPTAAGDSPYSAYSAFAGNPLLISLDALVSKGWLTQSDIDRMQTASPGSTNAVDFALARIQKQQAMHAAFERFNSQVLNASGTNEQRERYHAFCQKNAHWLDDFALFAAIKDDCGTFDWTTWKPEIAMRDPLAVQQARQEFEQEITFAKFIQFVFGEQLDGLREYANANQVRLFGDMPIFVAHQSSDVWANQELFTLDASGNPETVAGVPPDYFSETGQLWGNPLYRWDALAATNYRWWTERFESALKAFDMLRIDHFRGFEAFWEIPADAETAVHGRWVAGPGAAPFRAAEAALGELPIIAEDLGMITPAVHQLREELDFPGMRVLQFGFDSADDDYHRPEAYPENSAAYTGTHDNETIMGWFNNRKENREGPDMLCSYLPSCSVDVHWNLINLLFSSQSETAIVPMQDLLGLDNSARMNTPGLANGNWGWRLSDEGQYAYLQDRLLQITTDNQRN
jgi:4-alpha-glucanotransferase